MKWIRRSVCKTTFEEWLELVNRSCRGLIDIGERWFRRMKRFSLLIRPWRRNSIFLIDRFWKESNPTFFSCKKSKLKNHLLWFHLDPIHWKYILKNKIFQDQKPWWAWGAWIVIIRTIPFHVNGVVLQKLLRFVMMRFGQRLGSLHPRRIVQISGVFRFPRRSYLAHAFILVLKKY